MAVVNPVWKVWELPNNVDVYGAGASGSRIQPAWHVVTVTWSGVNGGDICTAAPTGFLTDLSIHVYGTLTSVAITGSNDNTNYFVLNDPQGNALSVIAAGKIEQILERTTFIQPTATTATAASFVLCGRLPIV